MKNIDYEFRRGLKGEVEVPDKLKPENIEKMLNEKQASGEMDKIAKQIKDDNKDDSKGKILSFVKSTKGVAVAACLCLIIGGSAFYVHSRLASDGDPDGNKPYSAEVENYYKAYDSIRRYGRNSGWYENSYDSWGVDLKGNASIGAIPEDEAIAVAPESNTSADTVDGASIQSNSADANLAQSDSASESGNLLGSVATAGENGVDEYSETNVRTEGVDEGDIVKTDGKYIYVCDGNESKLKIYEANDGKPIHISTTDFSDCKLDYYNIEMYINGNNLILIGNKGNGYTSRVYEDVYTPYETNSLTKIEMFDITDKSAPCLKGQHKQAGYYSTSRMIGDVLYTFSVKDVYIPKDGKRKQISKYIPKVDGDCVENEEVIVDDTVSTSCYTVVTGLRLGTEEFVDKKAILGGDGTCYVTNNGFYLTDYEWFYIATQGKKKGDIITQNEYFDMTNSGNEAYRYYGNSFMRTNIRKYGLEGGVITELESNIISGSVLNDYCIDEYNGYLRVVTNGWPEDSNEYRSVTNVFVLDSKMEVVGTITDIAKGEEVKSARFMGDVGYFVTYLNTDPLFSVDLSNPTNPKIIGKLKIPGFSEYMHPYGDGLMLGVGIETDEDSNVLGIKFSMFDVSDPSNVTEVDKLVLNKYESTSISWGDTNSIIVDPEKNIIGLTAIYRDGDYNEYCDYLVLSYDKGRGFEKKLAYDRDSFVSEFEDFTNIMRQRGLYINDYFYIANAEKGVSSFTMGDFELVSEME